MIEENAIPLNDEGPEAPEVGRDWLAIARDAYKSSTSYMDSNWRKKWEDSIAMFQSRHPAGSKYNSEAYKHKSRLFRPKTRMVVRKNEAAAAVAYFSNPDVVSIEAEDGENEVQQASAEVMLHLANYRLEKSIPWFQILIGAVQTAQVIGVVCSYQYWHYKERVNVSHQMLTDDMGQPMMGADGPIYQPVENVEVLEDKPCIQLLPPENYRFDPGADWLDPVKSSPYFIRLVPMYVADVREMMKSGDRKTGRQQWTEYSDAEIRMAMADYDTTRAARENNREDPLSERDKPLTEFEIVWCHENFVRLDGEEVVYWTLGTHQLLTEPTPLEQVYFHGVRPFVIGTCVIEANRVVPDSLVQMGASLQRETNDTINQRRDNVSLVLNKRYVVARGRDVDVQSLLRNAAGSVTMATSVDDIREFEWNDVTASSYQEQDRLNVDFDELTGNFSSSSVMTNRKLNETVGGMQMLGGSANQLTEYLLLTLTKTWIEPALRQLVKLEQAYETDEVVLSLAGQRAQLLQKYGVDQITDSLLNQELTVKVNVGRGATDPQMKQQRFTAAMQTYSGVMNTVPDADPMAVRKEVFGLAGYQDGGRFFKKGMDPKDAQLQQAQQMMQAMQQEIERLKSEKSAQSIQQLADADLKQAQTAKTLTEAMLAPSIAMQAQAMEPEQRGA